MFYAFLKKRMAAQKLVRRGHQLELLQQAKSQCDLKQHVDLTIYCEDGVVRAHQMLLATASPFLKLLFQTSPLYGVDDISLVLPEVKACLVQALVHFVYTGTVVSKEDHFYSLMKLVYALNMNASIEAESTTEKPTTFATVEKRLPPPSMAPPPPLPTAVASAPAMAPPPAPAPAQTALPPQYLSSQPLTLPASSPSAISLPSQPVAMAQLPTQPLAQLPSQPPAAKMPRLSTAAPAAAALPNKVQLPTQPVPLAGVINGQVKQEPQPQQQQQQQPQTQSYIAMDPTTGLSYKVEMANGTAAAAPAPDASSDPLAAIMNETIFTDTSGSKC